MGDYLKKLSIQVVGAAIGAGLAIAGSLYVFEKTRTIEEEQRRVVQREASVSSVRAVLREVASNKIMLQSIRDRHQEFRDLQCEPIDRHECPIQFTLLKDDAWKAMISLGGSDRIGDEETLRVLREHYFLVSRLNYIADKVKAGRYDKAEGKAFEKNALKALDALGARAFEALSRAEGW